MIQRFRKSEGVKASVIARSNEVATKQSRETNWIAAPLTRLAMMFVLTAGLAGCLADKTDVPVVPPAGGQEAVFGLAVPGMKVPSETRALDAAKEKEVTEIDVVIFKNSDNTLAEYHHIGSADISAAQGANDYKFKVKSVENAENITVAVIANASVETADALNAVKSSGTYVGAAKKDFLLALQVAAGSKWNTSASGYWKIPMYGEAVITGNIYNAALPTVNLVRMLAKVDVVNSVAPANPASPADGTFALTAVHVVNYNTKGVVAPAWNASTGILAGTPATTANIPAGFTPGTRAWADGNELTYTLATGQTSLLNEIYLFESDALSGNPPTPSGLRLVFEGNYTTGGVTKHYYYPADFTGAQQGGVTPYLPVLRNHHYTFTISAAQGRGYDRLSEAVAEFGVMSNLKTSIIVVDESGIKHLAWNGEHFIGLAEKSVTLESAANSTADVKCVTNYSGGWQIDASKGVNGIEYVNGTGWLSAVKNGAAGDLRADITVTTLSMNNGVYRMAYVHLKAGRVTHKLTVIQDGLPYVDPETTKDNLPETFISYIGAFWKADQRGERLINLPITSAKHAGKWAVQVLEYGAGFSEGDILFEHGLGSNSGSTTDPDDISAQYYVNGNATYLVGYAAEGGSISFRIGLSKKWSEQPGYATRPVRYAKVVLSFGIDEDNPSQPYYYSRVMYIRQGHVADYLMSPGDAISNATGAAVPTNRTTAYIRKFSPYNLTAPGMSDAEYTDIPAARGGTFTKYPTQAGAFFQWANNIGGYERRAWHPTKDATTWNGGGYFSWTWNAATYETCPNAANSGDGLNYRRPTIVFPPNGINTVSETGVSLVAELTQLTGNRGNSVWGYYADGFFDRRLNTAVSTTNVADGSFEVAYVGQLLYNPITASPSYGASVFFPAAGTRGATVPQTGVMSHYWSSVGASGLANTMLLSNASITHSLPFQMFNGLSVRCVAE